MKTINMTIPQLLLLALLVFMHPANAEQSQDFGDFVVHYNAITTDFLTPQIAKLYNIKRSKNRAMLNITVLKKHMGLASLPSRANVDVRAVNLNNQLKTTTVREITDGGAIYYIGEFPVSHQETLDFKIEVTVPGSKTQAVSFRQQFFTK